MERKQDAAPSLSYEELRDLQDSLRRPLTNRSVLIPLGPQAFVPGKLQPKLKAAENNEGNEELVTVVTTDDGRKQMTRTEAMAYFQSEMDRIRNKKKKAPSPILEQKSSTTATATPANNTTPQKSNGGFFEIREELNERGQEIRSEAIDVTQQLHQWEEQIRQANATGTSIQNETATAATTASTKLTGEEEMDVEMMLQNYDDKDDRTKKPVSDEEYEALAARLDELARLEEEAEKQEITPKGGVRAKLSSTNKSDSTNSNLKQEAAAAAAAAAKKPTGWTKGFLNSKPRSKPKPPPLSSTTAQTKHQAQAATDKVLLSSLPRKVGFSDETQVKEIPRVGDRSVRDIARPATTTTISKKPAAPTTPIEGSSMFSGIVQERKPCRKKRNPRVTPNNNSNKSSDVDVDSDSLERPLSRFAQQRQEMEQFQ